MKTLLRWLGGLVALVAVLFLASLYWFFYDNRPPRPDAPIFTLTDIRDEADRIPGAKASHIEIETVSHTLTPRIIFIAGASWEKVDLVRNSYRVVFPNSALIVDTGQSPSDAKRFGANLYDEEAWSRVLAALKTANQIVITHGHSDHAGGLLALADDSRVTASARLSAAAIQTMRSGGLAATRFTPAIENEGLLAIAPGVVLVAAPGHTPCSQWIYVQTSDQKEFLFVGDTATLAESVLQHRIPPRLTTERLGDEDRRALFQQIADLQALLKSEPAMSLVPGHDSVETERLMNEGWLKRGFSVDPPR